MKYLCTLIIVLTPLLYSAPSWAQDCDTALTSGTYFGYTVDKGHLRVWASPRGEFVESKVSERNKDLWQQSLILGSIEIGEILIRNRNKEIVFASSLMIGEKSRIPSQRLSKTYAELTSWLDSNYRGEKITLEFIHTHPNEGVVPHFLSGGDVKVAVELADFVKAWDVVGFVEMSAITHTLTVGDLFDGRFRKFFHKPTFVVPL